MLDRLEARFILQKTVEIPIPGMDTLSLCVDDKNLKLEKCSGCKKAYKCTVNARRCEASHPTTGKAAKRVVVSSSVPVDSTAVAEFWDAMPREERLVLIGDSWEPNTDEFAAARGGLLLATIDYICEGTHLLRLVKKPGFTSGMMMTREDQVANQVHAFSEKMVKAYTDSQEKQLLALLEDEQHAKAEVEKKKEAKRYAKYLKRLEHQIFNAPSTTFSWWEDDDEH
jgi:hypothetical protein